MRVFEIKPTSNIVETYSIEASHKWGLPGVNCPFCGQAWANTGLAYPSIELTQLKNADSYLVSRLVSLNEYVELKNKLSEVLTKDLLVMPGTEFGSLIGKLKGYFKSFVWVNYWTLLAQKDLIDVITNLGVVMPVSVPTNLVDNKKRRLDLMELQIEPFAEVGEAVNNEILGDNCQHCGRVAISKPNKVILKEISIPETDIFRGKELTSTIFATENFRRAIIKLGCTEIEFSEVEVSP